MLAFPAASLCHSCAGLALQFMSLESSLVSASALFAESTANIQHLTFILAPSAATVEEPSWLLMKAARCLFYNVEEPSWLLMKAARCRLT